MKTINKKKNIKKIDLPSAINAIALQAKIRGISSFVLGFKDSAKNAVLHFEQIPLNEAADICGFAWMQVIQNELTAHPEYPKERAAIFQDALADFKKLLAKINKRMAGIKPTNKKKN